jgi:MazG family protein
MADPKIDKLTQIIKILRDKNGCPWDKKQTSTSMAIYLIEEVYELVEAIRTGESQAVCEEIGDVLFLLLFITELYTEQNTFDLQAVITHNAEKMTRRHPHVFGEASAETTTEIRQQWHQIKMKEANNKNQKSVLDSVPSDLPALMRAYRVSERAARTGFDWPDLNSVLQKVEEEWDEFKDETDRFQAEANSSTNEPSANFIMEFGDLLFTLVNVARFAKIHPETALAGATHKFNQRFKYMEKQLNDQGKKLNELSMDEMEAAWQIAKEAIDVE